MTKDYIYIKQAWRRIPRNMDISMNQFRAWVRDGKHGIVGGRFGSRIVVREDTIPKVEPLQGGADEKAD